MQFSECKNENHNYYSSNGFHRFDNHKEGTQFYLILRSTDRKLLMRYKLILRTGVQQGSTRLTNLRTELYSDLSHGMA